MGTMQIRFRTLLAQREVRGLSRPLGFSVPVAMALSNIISRIHVLRGDSIHYRLSEGGILFSNYSRFCRWGREFHLRQSDTGRDHPQSDDVCRQ